MEQIPTLNSISQRPNIGNNVNTSTNASKKAIKKLMQENDEKQNYAKSVFYDDRRTGRDRRDSDDFFATGPDGIERRSGRDQRLIATLQSY